MIWLRNEALSLEYSAPEMEHARMATWLALLAQRLYERVGPYGSCCKPDNLRLPSGDWKRCTRVVRPSSLRIDPMGAMVPSERAFRYPKWQLEN